MSHGISSTSNEGQTEPKAEDAFDFDAWIEDNGLSGIKDIFIKHEMKDIGGLSILSRSFQKFASDPDMLTKNAHLIPVAVSAMQKLANMIQKLCDICT